MVFRFVRFFETQKRTCKSGLTLLYRKWYDRVLKSTVSCVFRDSIISLERRKFMRKVGIVMGSDSDLPVIKKTTEMLKTFDVPYEVHVFSAHRTPDEARDFARSARENGIAVLIAAAGMAAHLAGAIAANTTLPVIGIPCKSNTFSGMDALLSTVMMPTGIPVAAVAVDGGANAALLALEILAVSDDQLAEKLQEKRDRDAAAVLEKDRGIMARLED